MSVDVGAILDQLDDCEAQVFRRARLLVEIFDGVGLDQVTAIFSVNVGDGLPSMASVVIDRYRSEVRGRIGTASGTRTPSLPLDLLRQLPLDEAADGLLPPSAGTETAAPSQVAAALQPRVHGEESKERACPE